MGTCGLGRLELHHILKKHRMMFNWRLALSTSNFLQDILRCYFGEKVLQDAELIVMSNGKYRSLEDTHEQFRILFGLPYANLIKKNILCYCVTFSYNPEIV